MVTTTSSGPAISAVNPREKALEDFRKKIMEHKEIEARLRKSTAFDSVLEMLVLARHPSLF